MLHELPQLREIPVLPPQIPVLSLDDCLALRDGGGRLNGEIARLLSEEAELRPRRVPLVALHGFPLLRGEGDVVEPAGDSVRCALPSGGVLGSAALDDAAEVVVDDGVEDRLARFGVLWFREVRAAVEPDGQGAVLAQHGAEAA